MTIRAAGLAQPHSAHTVARVHELWERVIDPDGRAVVFDAGSHLHLAQGERDHLLDRVDFILGTVARPDVRTADPLPGRERFYRRNVVNRRRWMRVVVDFNDVPGWVVTALVQDYEPR